MHSVWLTIMMYVSTCTIALPELISIQVIASGYDSVGLGFSFSLP
jgi:hypothetical protein